RHLVDEVQDPDHLAEGYVRDEERLVRVDGALDQSGRRGGLRLVVFNQESHEDVGVERDHRSGFAAPRRTAAFMSSRLTPRTRGWIAPLSVSRSTVSASMTMLPSSRSRNATWS